MVNVPILDDAYMERRAQQRRRQFELEHYNRMTEAYAIAMRGRKRAPKPDRPDSLENAKRRFVDGKLTLEKFEAEVDRLLARDAR